MDYEVPQHVINYLQKKFSEGRCLLVVGAGFSGACVNTGGEPIPLGSELTRRLWDMVLPGESYDGSSLQDVFHMALRSKRKDLAALLERELSVDPKRVPRFYLTYFALPWSRVYTLNVDNLPVVAQGNFTLPSPLSLISSRPAEPMTKKRHGALDIVHLNGMLKDGVENLTFATLQYAERLTGQDPLYAQLVAEMQTHPTVFIGTVLNEPSLWQHVELRKTKGVRGAGEQRPRSFIVTPSLEKARQSLLREFNVEWIPLSAEQFEAQVLSRILGTLTTGRIVDIRNAMLVGQGKDTVPSVADLLARAGDSKTEYLRGQEPSWVDVTKERIAPRSIDEQLYQLATTRLRDQRSGMILVTGTAGAGKSSSMMSLAAHLANDGCRSGYCDRSLDVDIHELQNWPTEEYASEQALFIDDADRYGNALSGLVSSLLAGPSCLVVLGVRSSRVERVLSSTLEESYDTVAMPPLEDGDIVKLLDVLERNQHLGRLAGMDRASRMAAMREQAGRQLLVAMIQATYGVRFEEKAAGEYEELTVEEKVVYSLAAVATHYGFEVRREEVLIAAGDFTNDVLDVIERLKRRSLLVPTRQERPNDLRVRHREVARIVCDRLAENQQAHVSVAGLARALASQDLRRSARNSRNWRFMKQLINHAILPRIVPDVTDVRGVYDTLEAVLGWDYHYWLQRGSLEVERGNVRDARQYLETAKSLNSEDHLVRTEYAYLQFRLAIESPRSPDAIGFVSMAIEALEEQIEERGASDFYPFHVLGSQGLAWSRHGHLAKEERRELLNRLLRLVEKGVRLHPFSNDLVALRDDLKKEVLSTAVARGSPGGQ